MRRAIAALSAAAVLLAGVQALAGSPASAQVSQGSEVIVIHDPFHDPGPRPVGTPPAADTGSDGIAGGGQGPRGGGGRPTRQSPSMSPAPTAWDLLSLQQKHDWCSRIEGKIRATYIYEADVRRGEAIVIPRDWVLYGEKRLGGELTERTLTTVQEVRKYRGEHQQQWNKKNCGLFYPLTVY